MANWQFIRARNNISTCAWPRELAVWPAVRGGVNQKGPNMQLATMSVVLVSLCPVFSISKTPVPVCFFHSLRRSARVASCCRATFSLFEENPNWNDDIPSSQAFVETSMVKRRPPTSSQMEATIIPMQLSMEFFAIDNINVGAPRFSSKVATGSSKGQYVISRCLSGNLAVKIPQTF